MSASGKCVFRSFRSDSTATALYYYWIFFFFLTVGGEFRKYIIGQKPNEVDCVSNVSCPTLSHDIIFCPLSHSLTIVSDTRENTITTTAIIRREANVQMYSDIIRRGVSKIKTTKKQSVSKTTTSVSDTIFAVIVLAAYNVYINIIQLCLWKKEKIIIVIFFKYNKQHETTRCTPPTYDEWITTADSSGHRRSPNGRANDTNVGVRFSFF